MINANKRAELIQLAVDGVLSLVVAADKVKIPLSRTTRERFLRRLVLDIAFTGASSTDERITELAGEFLLEYSFDVSRIEFLEPFFRLGLLYRAGDNIEFSHPYLRSYLLAQALKEEPGKAEEYFSPDRREFDYYTYDLYCELGPSTKALEAVCEKADAVLLSANAAYSAPHIYIEKGLKLTTLSSGAQLASLTNGLVSSAERLEKPVSDDSVRAQKQQILDARRQVRSQVSEKSPDRLEQLPDEVALEFSLLDDLSRTCSLCAIALGSGAEALAGDMKAKLGQVLLNSASKFSDIWTRNRLRVDFEELRKEVLEDAHIWQVMEQSGADKSSFDAVKSEMNIFLYGLELSRIMEPMGRILWGTSQMAGVRVLSPILGALEDTGPVEAIMRACWIMDVDPERGRDLLKASFSNYSGSPLARLVVANHLLWRVFWHHYRTRSADFFISGVRRTLKPMGLVPSSKQLEQVKKGSAKSGEEN